MKREMALSPNDEEVADPSKTHTQFKTRVHKPYPISDPIPYFRPKRLKKTCPLARHMPIQSVFTHVASIYANLLEQKKAFAYEKS